MGYSLDSNRPTPYKVIDITDEWGREGVYSGTYEDCQAFIAERSNCRIIPMYDIVPTFRIFEITNR